jgi:hypothetical protein
LRPVPIPTESIGGSTCTSRWASRLKKRRLVVHKWWLTPLRTPRTGIPLPDREFSNRFVITHGEPQGFALRVFSYDGLHRRFRQTVGRRQGFTLNLEGRSLLLSTRVTWWTLPSGGVEWRPGELNAMIDALCDVAEAAEAAEAAPKAPWNLDHLAETPEAAGYRDLGGV